jgi:FkbH-like protein
MRVSLLSNTNMMQLSARLPAEYNCWTPDGYGVWVQELLRPDAELYKPADNMIFLLIDGTPLFQSMMDKPEDIKNEILTYFRYFTQAAEGHPGSSFFISNLDIRDFFPTPLNQIPVAHKIESWWLEQLGGLLASCNNVFLFDLKGLCAGLGQRKFYSNLLWYSGGFSWSSAGEKLIAERIRQTVGAKYGHPMKALALDLDNTLWGGVLGEEGADGISLSEAGNGARYKDFQRILKYIQQSGTLLCIASKNNYDDVREVFATHRHMLLKQQDIVASRINWEPKAPNIAQMAKELNIGVDSFVFIDDNPVERGAVTAALPEVITPDFPEHTTDLREFAKEIYNNYFLRLSHTAEDAGKTQMYIQDKSRKEAEKVSVSQEDYLRSLETKLTVQADAKEDIERIAQLTQKTNQFNLLTKRYQTEDIRGFIESPDYTVLAGRVADKYGDLGLTAVLILRKTSKSEAEIDTFLMSCRIMGRFIERRFLNWAERFLYEKGCTSIRAAFERTKKNQATEYIYEQAGYTLTTQSSNAPDRKEYTKILTGNNWETETYGIAVLFNE